SRVNNRPLPGVPPHPWLPRGDGVTEVQREERLTRTGGTVEDRQAAFAEDAANQLEHRNLLLDELGERLQQVCRERLLCRFPLGDDDLCNPATMLHQRTFAVADAAGLG